MDTRTPKKSPARLLIAVGCLGATMVCCVAGGGLVWYANTQVDRVAAASSACDGRPVAGVSPRSTARPARVVAFERNGSGGWGYAGSLLPGAWSDIEDADEAELVFCFEPEERRRLETCSYESGIRLHRYHEVRRVRAVDAATGQVVREAQVFGRAPDPCPETISTRAVYGVDVTTGDREDVGPDVSGDEVDTVFRDAVNPGVAPAVQPL